MHQHPRPFSPRSATSANSAQANPLRSNNERERVPSRTPSSQDLTTEPDRLSPRMPQELRPFTEDEKFRLNQVVQRFYSKTALTILSSRVSLAPIITKNGDVKMDRWFNTLIEDSDAVNQALRDWKSLDCFEEKPAPLVIEVYLDTAQLAQNQSLVALDEDERPWDVSEALQDMGASTGQVSSKLVYERWSISLDDTAVMPPSALTETGPSIYKKGVVAMRALYTYTKYLPAWRLGRRMGRQAGNGPMLRPRYRIVDASSVMSSNTDTLTCPLFPSEEDSTAETFQFAPLNCVFGSLKVEVTYRRNCDFYVEATERLLSTKAMSSARETRRTTTPTQRPERQHAQSVPQAPVTHRGLSSDDNSAKAIGLGRVGSLSGRPSRLSADLSAARSAADPAIARRPSVSFQPFKAGSLSSSPSSSIGRANSLLSHSRNRSSVTTLPQQALRTPQIANEAAVTSSASSSPKPAPLQRYSSSFSNRKSRFPSSGNIKNEDDGLSSGRGSISSVPRGSGIIPEPEPSSASGDADTDNIAEYLKLLDRNKGLQSFNKTDQATATQRTAAQYSKFARMRESTTQLSESMSSSLMLHRSSSTSSRQLHNVPGMIAGSSFSTSSSPGKPISPHTPHMPAIPSRLSNNSIIADYSHEARRVRPAVNRAPDSRDGSMRARSPPREHGTPASTAIDIPTSPRTFPANRRSSSAAQQPRTRPEIDEQDVLPYGLRSASLPNEQGAELSLSELLAQAESGGSASRRRRDQGPPTSVEDDDEPLLFALAEAE